MSPYLRAANQSRWSHRRELGQKAEIALKHTNFAEISMGVRSSSASRAFEKIKDLD